MLMNMGLYDLACLLSVIIKAIKSQFHGFQWWSRTEDVVSQDAHIDLVNLQFCCQQP